MPNKYLEKLAGGFSEGLGRAGKAVAGVAKDIVADAAHSAHMALGGGYRDAAREVHKITSQDTLRKIHNPETYVQAVHSDGVHGITDAHRAEIKDLQHDRAKGIIKTVGYTAVAAHAGNKILNKIHENDTPQYYQ